jgi:hypothetical protein
MDERMVVKEVTEMRGRCRMERRCRIGEETGWRGEVVEMGDGERSGIEGRVRKDVRSEWREEVGCEKGDGGED